MERTPFSGSMKSTDPSTKCTSSSLSPFSHSRSRVTCPRSLWTPPWTPWHGGVFFYAASVPTSSFWHSVGTVAFAVSLVLASPDVAITQFLGWCPSQRTRHSRPMALGLPRRRLLPPAGSVGRRRGTFAPLGGCPSYP